MNTSPIWKQRLGCWCTLAYRSFPYATLIIAALYALQLAWIDYQLKNKKLAFNQEMPPLMSIERKMFHITQIGVVLLTLTLCTGLFYMHNLFSMENIDKAVLSIVAWFVYIVLLWGHYHEGWAWTPRRLV